MGLRECTTNWSPTNCSTTRSSPMTRPIPAAAAAPLSPSIFFFFFSSILALILLQKVCFPRLVCIFRFLLSNSQPVHSSSRCSWDSSMGPLQKLHERLLRCELLWFIFTPFIILALTLIHSRLSFRVIYVIWELYFGSSLTLSPTLVLPFISARLDFQLSVLIALMIWKMGYFQTYPGKAYHRVPKLFKGSQLTKITKRLRNVGTTWTSYFTILWFRMHIGLRIITIKIKTNYEPLFINKTQTNRSSGP